MPALSQPAQEYISARFDGTRLTEKIDYNYLLTIPGADKQNRGKDTSIAVLDHPISKNITFGNPVTRPFGSGETTNNHANIISGLIAGPDNIGGMAAACNLLELPLYDEDGFPVPLPTMEKMLDHLLALEKPLIVNISQKLNSSLKPRIEKVAAKHLVIACAGMDIELEAIPRFPANVADVIAVGCVTERFLDHKMNAKVDVLIPDISYVSYNTNQADFVYGRGDSFSCAVISAIAALLISGKPHINAAEFRAKLKEISVPFNGSSVIDSLNPIIPNK